MHAYVMMALYSQLSSGQTAAFICGPCRRHSDIAIPLYYKKSRAKIFAVYRYRQLVVICRKTFAVPTIDTYRYIVSMFQLTSPFFQCYIANRVAALSRNILAVHVLDFAELYILKELAQVQLSDDASILSIIVQSICFW